MVSRDITREKLKLLGLDKEFAKIYGEEDPKEPPVIDGWDYMGGSETALLSLRIGSADAA